MHGQKNIKLGQLYILYLVYRTQSYVAPKSHWVNSRYQNLAFPLHQKQEISNILRCMEAALIHSYILCFNTSIIYLFSE